MSDVGLNLNFLKMNSTEQIGGKNLKTEDKKSNYSDGLTQSEAVEIDKKYGDGDGVLTEAEYKKARQQTDKASDSKISNDWLQCIADFNNKKMNVSDSQMRTAESEINQAWNLLPDYLKSMGLDKLDSEIFNNFCTGLDQYLRVEGNEVKTNNIDKLVNDFLAGQDQSKIKSTDASTIANVMKKMAGKYGNNDKLSAADFYSPVLAYAIVNKGGKGTTSAMNSVMSVLNNNMWGASTNKETLVNELQNKLASIGIKNISNSDLMALLTVAENATNMQTSDVNTSKSIKKEEGNHNAVSTSKNGATALINDAWNKIGLYIEATGCKDMSNSQILPELYNVLNEYLSDGNEILSKDLETSVKGTFKNYLAQKGIELTDDDANKIITSLTKCAEAYGSNSSLSMSDFYSVTMAYSMAAKNCNDNAAIEKNMTKMMQIINNSMWGSNMSADQITNKIYNNLSADMKSNWSKAEIKELVDVVSNLTMGEKDLEKTVQNKTAQKQIDNTWKLRADWLKANSGTDIRPEVMDGLMECLDSYLQENQLLVKDLDKLVNNDFKNWLSNKGIVLNDNEAKGIVKALTECAKSYGSEKTFSMSDFYSAVFSYALSSKADTTDEVKTKNMTSIMNLINNNMWGSNLSKEDIVNNTYNKLPAETKSAWSKEEYSAFVDIVFNGTMGEKDNTEKVNKNTAQNLINNSWNLRKEWLISKGANGVRDDVMNGLIECMDEYLKTQNIDLNNLNKLIGEDFANWLKSNKGITLASDETQKIITSIKNGAGAYGKTNTFSSTDFYSPVLAHTLLSKSDSSKITTANMQKLMDAINNKIWGSNKTQADITDTIKAELTNLGIDDWSDAELNSLVNLVYDGTMIGNHNYDAINTFNSINGEIDDWVRQGATGDCWLVSSVLSLNSTDAGKQIIKDAIKVEDNGDVSITFKGLGISYTIPADEIMAHDTDNIFDEYSNGDNDMLVIELGFEKLFADIRGGKYPELKSKIFDSNGIEAQNQQIFMSFFTGNDVNEIFNGRNSVLNLTTLDTELDKVANSDSVVAGFSLYGGSGLTHSAKCTDGTEFSFSFQNAEDGHGFAILSATADEVTFCNPHDSTIHYTMTREEFQKLGVGYICTTDLNNQTAVIPELQDPILPDDTKDVEPSGDTEPTTPSPTKSSNPDYKKSIDPTNPVSPSELDGNLKYNEFDLNEYSLSLTQLKHASNMDGSLMNEQELISTRAGLMEAALNEGYSPSDTLSFLKEIRQSYNEGLFRLHEEQGISNQKCSALMNKHEAEAVAIARDKGIPASLYKAEPYKYADLFPYD